MWDLEGFFLSRVARDESTPPGAAPPLRPDDLEAVLEVEKAMYAIALTIIIDCERQIDERSALRSPQDPALRYLRHTLSHALVEARESRKRQATLRTQLRLVSEYRQRIEGNPSGLGFALDRFLQDRDETRRMAFAASAQVFGNVAHGARVVARQVMSLCEGMIGQGIRIGRACSEVWQRLRADLVDKEKEVKRDLKEAKEEEEKANQDDEDNE